MELGTRVRHRGIHAQHHLMDDALDVIEALLEFQRVIDPVVALVVELLVVHGGVVLEVRATRGLDEAVRHEGARGDNDVDPAVIDHVAEHEAHLRDGHRAREGADYEAVLVLDHRLQHVGGFAQRAPGKRRMGHRPEELVRGVDGTEVQRLECLEAVGDAIVQLADLFDRVFARTRAVQALVVGVAHGRPSCEARRANATNHAAARSSYPSGATRAFAVVLQPLARSRSLASALMLARSRLIRSSKSR